LVVVDVSAAICAVERMDVLDKRLWRLAAMVMALTLCVAAATVSLFML